MSVLKSGHTPPDEYQRLWSTLRSGKLFESNTIVDQKKDGTLFTLFTIIFTVTYGNRKFYVQILEDRPKQNGQVHALKQEFTDALKE